MALNRAVPGAGATAASAGTHSTAGGQRARWTLGEMIGRNPAMERLFLQIRYLANHLRVGMVEGEPGTGKLLAATTLHTLAAARGSEIAACPAAEFFAGEGAGAVLQQAAGGLLYLPHVEQLNHEQQGRLLHLLGWLQQHGQGAARLRHGSLPAQSRIEFPAGQAAPRAVLAAASRSLRPLVQQGRFRGDLYQQLSSVHLVLPPLRDRREDIAMLVESFLARIASEYGKPPQGIAHDALSRLLAHSWTGNVAELRMVVVQAALRATDGWLRAADLHFTGPAPAADLPGQFNEHAQHGLHQPGSRRLAPAAAHACCAGAGRTSAAAIAGQGGSGISADPQVNPYKPDHWNDSHFAATTDKTQDPNLDRAILRHVRDVLAGANGNKLRAARLLGISRSTLYRLLEPRGGDIGAATAHDARPAPRPAAG